MRILKSDNASKSLILSEILWKRDVVGEATVSIYDYSHTELVIISLSAIDFYVLFSVLSPASTQFPVPSPQKWKPRTKGSQAAS